MKWRVNFSIGPKSVYFDLCMPYAALLPATITPKSEPPLLREFIIEYVDGMMRGLVPIEVINTVVEWIKNKIVTDPAWADELHQHTEQVNRTFFEFTEEIRSVSLSSLNKTELARVALRLRDLLGHAHADGWATTWFVDSDGERFSSYLRQALGVHLESRGISEPAKIINIFVLLSTPRRPTLLQDEQKEFLGLVRDVQQREPVLNTFLTLGSASEIYCHLPKDTQLALREHYEKWCWVPYGYIGPAYTLEHYVEEIQKTLLSGIDVSMMMQTEDNRLDNLHNECERVEKEIELTPHLQKMFAIARDIIWLKDYRKLCQFHGFYVLHQVTGEIARRLNLTLKQATHLFNDEIPAALDQDAADEHKLNERLRHTVAYITPMNVTYYTGEEARAFMERIEIEETHLDPSGEMRGSCACPGVVEGEVKIINTIDDMSKMRQGDIMVAHTTFPALVPAMKKAVAIVTEDGGITCHAAIVARELRIPCVVGVREILQAVADGDRVRVDATKGLIKKL